MNCKLIISLKLQQLKHWKFQLQIPRWIKLVLTCNTEYNLLSWERLCAYKLIDRDKKRSMEESTNKFWFWTFNGFIVWVNGIEKPYKYKTSELKRALKVIEASNTLKFQAMNIILSFDYTIMLNARSQGPTISLQYRKLVVQNKTKTLRKSSFSLLPRQIRKTNLLLWSHLQLFTDLYLYVLG